MLGYKALAHRQAKATAQPSQNPSSTSDPNLPAPLPALLENNKCPQALGLCQLWPRNAMIEKARSLSLSFCHVSIRVTLDPATGKHWAQSLQLSLPTDGMSLIT